jgi:hypothetical protein
VIAVRYLHGENEPFGWTLDIFMPIPLSGNIQTTPLSDILEELRTSKATGTLTITSRGMVKSIYVKAGAIVFASSSDTNDRLGEILVKCSRLTRQNLEHALRLYNKSAGLKKMGAILVENGFLSPKDLFNGLKIQIKDIIYSLFLWPEGDFRFEKQLPSDVIQLQVNIHELISEIIQRIKQES